MKEYRIYSSEGDDRMALWRRISPNNWLPVAWHKNSWFLDTIEQEDAGLSDEDMEFTPAGEIVEALTAEELEEKHPEIFMQIWEKE